MSETPDARPPELIEEKKFYERFWALHDNPDLVEIYRAFGPAVFRRSSVLEGFGAFIKEVGFGGDLCVEIGTCYGLTAIVLARHFKKVVSIDIDPNAQRNPIAAHLGIDNINFMTVTDNAAKAGLLKYLKFDAAYIDGDHARDTRSDFDLVKRCGNVLFHEYWPAQTPVWNLVHELAMTGKIKTSGKLALWTS